MNSGDVWVLRERRKDRPWVPCLFRSWALDGEVADCFTPKFGRASVDGGVESGGKREKRRWILGTDQAEGTPRGWGGRGGSPLGSSHPKRVPRQQFLRLRQKECWTPIG